MRSKGSTDCPSLKVTFMGWKTVCQCFFSQPRRECAGSYGVQSAGPDLTAVCWSDGTQWCLGLYSLCTRHHHTCTSTVPPTFVSSLAPCTILAWFDTLNPVIWNSWYFVITITYSVLKCRNLVSTYLLYLICRGGVCLAGVRGHTPSKELGQLYCVLL